MAIFLVLAATASLQSSPTDAAVEQGDSVEQSLTYADIDVGVGYATNPLLAVGESAGRTFGRIGARLVHQRRSVRSSTLLSGYVENSTYTGSYGSTQLAGLAARHEFAASEKVSVYGDVNASYDEGGQLATRLVTVPTIEQPITDLPSLPGAPLDYYSLTGRTYHLSGQLGSRIKTSLRDSATVRGGYSRTARRGTGFDSDQSDLFGSAGYDRQLSERATVGAMVTARTSHFEADGDEPDGDTRVITPQITGSVLLSERTRVAGAVGVSIAKVETGTTSESSVGLAANVSLCRTGEFDLLCGAVSRDQQVATVAGPANSLAASLTYSRKLSARETLALSAVAARYSGGSPVDPDLQIHSNRSISASVVYTRTLSSRLSGGATIAARKVSRSGPDPRADVSGSIFLRYRLGDLF